MGKDCPSLIRAVLTFLFVDVWIIWCWLLCILGLVFFYIQQESFNYYSNLYLYINIGSLNENMPVIWTTVWYLPFLLTTSLVLPKFQLTLDFLRDRLAEVHMEHLDRGCRLKPRFCIKTKFNLTALYIVCEGCDTFEVVI